MDVFFLKLSQKKPLFPGDSEIDQIFRIFRILGTPKEENWQGVTSLKDYKSSFPNWGPQKITSAIANLNLDESGVDLLMRMLKYDPDERITAKSALKHPYFKDLFDKKNMK